jgi:hypothetical protein
VPSAAEEAELKASIKARGLKQNLVVHPSADTNGVHAVTAGGRRLKALQALAAEGVIPADTEVPCLIEALDEAQDGVQLGGVKRPSVLTFRIAREPAQTSGAIEEPGRRQAPTRPC